MTDHPAAIKAAIQAMLDEQENDGYMVAQIVIGMALERLNADGHIVSIPWVWSPPEQPDWQTTALLEAAADLQAQAEIDD